MGELLVLWNNQKRLRIMGKYREAIFLKRRAHRQPEPGMKGHRGIDGSVRWHRYQIVEEFNKAFREEWPRVDAVSTNGNDEGANT